MLPDTMRQMAGRTRVCYPPDLRFLEPPIRNWLLGETGSAVTRLMDPPDDGASGSVRPAERAHVQTHQMLVSLKGLNFHVAATDVYSDPDGAIRLLWAREGRNVELVFPSIQDEAPYLYHSGDDNYGIEERPSPECALIWINWALDNRSPKRVQAA